MLTRVIRIDPLTPDTAIVEQAASVLRAGGLVAFSTETVYGLAAIMSDSRAVTRVFQVKGRSFQQPLPVQVASRAQIPALVGFVSETAQELIERFMPGPLTIVLPASLGVPGLVTAGTGTIGIRIPDHPLSQAILREVGQPLVVTSANRHGATSPCAASEVLAQLDGFIDLLLDGGECRLGTESTVVDVTCEPPRVLRLGAVAIADIEQTIGRAVTGPKSIP